MTTHVNVFVADLGTREQFTGTLYLHARHGRGSATFPTRLAT